MANHESSAEHGFYISKGLKKFKRRIFFDTWKLYAIRISVSINKVLLEHSCIYSFPYCWWLLSCYSSKRTMDHKAENIYNLAPYRKCLLIPKIENKEAGMLYREGVIWEDVSEEVILKQRRVRRHLRKSEYGWTDQASVKYPECEFNYSRYSQYLIWVESYSIYLLWLALFHLA